VRSLVLVVRKLAEDAGEHSIGIRSVGEERLVLELDAHVVVLVLGLRPASRVSQIENPAARSSRRDRNCGANERISHASYVLSCCMGGKLPLVLGSATGAATAGVEEGDHRHVLAADVPVHLRLGIRRAEERGRDGGSTGALDSGTAASRHLHRRVESRGSAEASEGSDLGGVHSC